MSESKRLKRIAAVLLRRAFAGEGGRVVDGLDNAYWSLKLRADWSTDPPPRFFDHRIDRGRWSETGDSFWLDRGVLNRIVMQRGCRVVDVGCGDGFYDKHFYAAVASHIDAFDVDDATIAHAAAHNAAANVTYRCANVAAIELDHYDVAVCDQCVQYMNVDERDAVFTKLARAATIVVGSTVASPSPRVDLGERSHVADADALRAVLSRVFAHVVVAAVDTGRVVHLHFRASTASDVALRAPF